MSIPFPSGPADKDVFFHRDFVCIYSAEHNAWTCNRVTPTVAQPSTTQHK